ncbi:hypothetical protein OHA77_09640 [Streptosporangium sp. NBC_01639]|nr:hypothetical protein OHA77_09640 [Streptosporangium sp. NBC_01639]
MAPILAQNAVPVFADADPLTGKLDPAAVAALVGPPVRSPRPIRAGHRGRSEPGTAGCTPPDAASRLAGCTSIHGRPCCATGCAACWSRRRPPP